MRRKRFTDEQITGILKEGDTAVGVADLCRTHRMPGATSYAWNAKHDGLELSDARPTRLKQQRRPEWPATVIGNGDSRNPSSEADHVGAAYRKVLASEA